MKRRSKGNKNEKIILDTSKADPSSDILSIQNNPDIAVWNRKVLIQGERRRKIKIGPLDQNLIRKDTNVPIDPANKESVSDVVISGAKVTDRVDLSKVNRKNEK